MPPLDVPGIVILNRPFKPVALGFVCLMATLMQANLRGAGTLGDTRWADILAVLTAVALVALIGGWWGKSQRMAEIGLLLVGSVYAIRATFIALTNWTDIGVGLSIGAAIIAFGSYMLEVRDPRGRDGGG